MGRVVIGQIKSFVPALVVACVTLVSSVGASSPSAVLQALDRQDAWLQSSPQRDGWNQYLRTDQLRQELEQGADANRRRVAEILGRYQSGVPGLNNAQFQQTRQQLVGWANRLRVPMAVRWAEQLRAASKHVQPINESTVRQARYELTDSANALQQMLLAASKQTESGWKSFLKWDTLESQLQLGTPNWTDLESVGAQFFDGHPGLEYPEFVRVRNSLRKYLYLGSLGANGHGQRDIASRMVSLADSLERYNSQPTTKHAAEVASQLEWLEQLGRVPELAQEIRRAHGRANVKIRVSEQLLNRRFTRQVTEPMNVREFILGTFVQGQAVTQGTISTDIVRSDNVARVDIVFRGNTQSQTVGRQKPVTIHSTSATALEARKPLYLFPNRVSAGPTRAFADTQTTIHGITPDNRLGRRLVEKVAWKKAQAQKPQAQQIASGRAARRLERQIDRQSTELLTRAQQALREQLRGPINRRGLIPEQIGTKSFDRCAVVFARQAAKNQFSATSEPRSFCPQDDVVVQIHESAVNNTAEKAIAGLTLTDARIAELTQELTGSVPDELKTGEDKQPWSISFDWQQPVTVEFDNETLTIAVRGRRFTSGDRILNKTMEMAATYSMQLAHTGVILTRQGEVQVSFPGQRGGRLSAMDRIFRTLMEKKFSEVFKPVIEGQGFQLPGRFEELGRLRLNDFSTSNGWISLGWK